MVSEKRADEAGFLPAPPYYDDDGWITGGAPVSTCEAGKGQSDGREPAPALPQPGHGRGFESGWDSPRSARLIRVAEARDVRLDWRRKSHIAVEAVDMRKG